MGSKMLAVIRREFMSRVTTRAFLIGTFLGPILMVGVSSLPVLLASRDTGAKRVAIVDGSSGPLGSRLEAALVNARRGDGDAAMPQYEVTRIAAPGRERDVRDSLLPFTARSAAGAATIDGILMVDDSVLTTGRVLYLGSNVGSPDAMRTLQRTVAPIVQGERLEATGVNPNVVVQALAPVQLQTRKLSNGTLTEESGSASFLLAYIMSFVLYLALLLYGVQVMTSVVEEKTSNIVEVLVSSVGPFDLMLGKVVGVGSAGLLQMTVWGGAALAFSRYRLEIARLFGSDAAGASSLPIPEMSPALLAVFLTFFIAGFLLYAAAYAAVGAVCQSTQEAQQAQMPVSIFILGGLISMFALLSEPNGTLAQTLSLFPPIAPFVVPVRYSLAPLPLLEVLLSLSVTVVGMLAVVWVASRIYRVGVLSHGKRASLADIWRWARSG